MEQSEIVQLVKELIGPNTQVHLSKKWVSLCCPLARWTHAKGRDTSPSAGISIKPGATSIFHCNACHKKGTLSWLVRELEMHTGIDHGDLADSLEDEEFFGGHIPDWGATAVDPMPDPIDKEEYFSLYDSAVGHPYLKKRGIDDATALRLELLHDPGDGYDGVERILFPVYSRDGLFYGFSGRATHKAKLKVKDYHGLPKKQLLLGAHLIVDQPFVVLAEGLVDYARLSRWGLGVMAFMSSTLTPEQAEIVKEIGKPTYFFHDDDEAGLDARDNARELLCNHVPLMKVRYPTECTVETPEGDLRPPEDPAELSKAQVMAMIEDARLM